jgi:signal transduction histidine kinase/tetratricopeptide (TPR) repeat protein
MLRLAAVAIVLVLSFTFVEGQQRQIDSLTTSLKNSSEELQRIDILNELAHSYYDYNSERGFEYASQAYQLAIEANDKPRIRRSLTLKGYYYYVKGNFAKALELYRESAAVDKERDVLYGYNTVMMGNTYRSMALYDSADRAYSEALALFAEIKSDRYLPFTYKNQVRLLLLKWRNDEAEEVLKKAIPLYEKNKSKIGLADTWFLMAEIYKNKAEYEKANAMVSDGCKIADQVGDEFLQLNCLINTGNLRSRLGDYPEALKIYIEALGILKTKDMPVIVTQLYTHIGDVYRQLDDNQVAMRYYNEALKIARRINVPYEEAKILGNMAGVVRSGGKLAEAEQLLQQSMDIRTRLEDEHGLSLCYTSLAQIRLQQKNLSEAERYLNLALDIRKKLNNREGIASALYNLSLVFAARKDIQKTKQLQMEALQIENSIGNKFSMGFSNNRLGVLFTDLGDYALAEKHLRLAEKFANETRSRTLLMNNELNWSRYFEKRGNVKSSLERYKRYNAVHDSIHNDIGAQRLAELQALYLMEKKDQEIAMLSQERQLQENEIQLQRSKINLQNIVIVSGVVGFTLLLILGLVHFGYTKRLQKAHREITEQKEEIQSQSEELIEANHTIAEINKKLEGKIEERTQALSQAYKELDTFFYRSSHDFRRPLTTFLGLAEVAKVTVKDHNALELFEKVRDTAVNLDKMLVKLQSISDVGSQQLVYKEVFIKDIFDTVCDSFRDEIHRKNIKTSAEFRVPDAFVSYPAMVKIIIENLVENAISFSGTERPFVKLKAVQNGDYLTLEIHDNGQGIGKEFHDQIFDMYYRANERSKGNGLGLYIVKKAVEKLDGSITVSSIPSVGTTFTVMLPMEHQFQLS